MEPIRTIRIESLAFGGDGIGRADGKVCFVRYAAPGDLLSVRIVEERGSYLRGEIVEVLEPGPDRRPPRCPYFGACGGCTWQHLDYAAQLEAKRQILADTMRRIGGVDAPVLPVLASASEYGYRTRTRLHRVRRRVGYFERASKAVVAVAECPILAPELEGRLEELAAAAGTSGAGRLQDATIELELDATGQVAERRVENPASRAAHRPPRGPEAGDEYAFHQVNRFVNEELTRLVSDSIVARAAGRPLGIIDLFCGNGNLSLPLASAASWLRGFDTSEQSIRRAAQAARSAGFEHAGYARMDAARGLEGVARELASGRARPGERGYLCVIADPPRSGMRGLEAAILALRPELLVYVSCNPPALARDARVYTDGGMELELLQPLDMFPQSYHLETVALFTRRDR